MIRYLQFGPGLCSTCKQHVTVALLVKEDGMRWFVNLAPMKLHQVEAMTPPMPVNDKQPFVEHMHPHWKNTELRHEK